MYTSTVCPYFNVFIVFITEFHGYNYRHRQSTQSRRCQVNVDLQRTSCTNQNIHMETQLQISTIDRITIKTVRRKTRWGCPAIAAANLTIGREARWHNNNNYNDKTRHIYKLAHTHTHTYVYIYKYIYIYWRSINISVISKTSKEKKKWWVLIFIYIFVYIYI